MTRRRHVPMPTKKAPREEPLFIEQEPVIHHPPHAWHHRVPYPYQFKWDGPWLFVLFLAAGGLVYSPLWLLAGFLAFLRGVVWCCHRFPLTSWFFIGLFQGLFGSSRRRW